MKKKFLLLSVACITLSSAFAQLGEWVWLRGSNFNNSLGSFGVQGVASPANDPPALYEPCEFTDLNGNFWMYGGADGGLAARNDLWKYDPTANEWTWMTGTNATNDPGVYGTQGVPSPGNRPPSRGWAAASWTDISGNFWFLGGLNSSSFNDLWEYNIATNEWTWMKGSNIPLQPGIYGTQGVPNTNNTPGARAECATTWTDNAGDLWLFGGYDFSANYYSDLWRFNIASNSWTWMKGPSISGQIGTYGTQGIEDPANNPGSRLSYCRWKDNTGNFWFFGGGDFLPSANDLWRYNPSTNNWAWMSGSNVPAAPGVYGTKCVSDASNVPGARFEDRAAWTDVGGNFWMFGGASDGGNLPNVYNDLWMFCVSTNEWTWVSGDNFPNAAGNWGTVGVSSPTNVPSSRGGGISWTDHNNHLYLFGGANPWPSSYNDIWKYTIDPSCAFCNSLPIVIFTAPHNVCPGTCTNFTNLSSNATSYLWSFPGASPSTSTDPNPTNICYNTPGNYSVTLIGTNATGSDTLTLNNYITVYAYPPPQGIAQNGDTLFANQGAVSYQWYQTGVLIPGATDYFYVATSGGDFNVVATDANNCEVEAAIFDVVASVQSMSGNVQFTSINPNPVVDKLVIVSSEFGDKNEKDISIFNLLGEKIYSALHSRLMTVDCEHFPSGTYWLEISNNKKTFRTKFIKK